MTTTTYSTRTDAIAAIIDAIEAHPAITWARVEYDIDAIADEVIGDYADGYRIAEGIKFWASVSRHARHARPTAQEIADQLNAYEGDNIWQDVICGLDIDRDAIEAADRNGDSNVVVLRNGTVIRWDARCDEWYVAYVVV